MTELKGIRHRDFSLFLEPKSIPLIDDSHQGTKQGKVSKIILKKLPTLSKGQLENNIIMQLRKTTQVPKNKPNKTNLVRIEKQVQSLQKWVTNHLTRNMASGWSHEASSHSTGQEHKWKTRQLSCDLQHVGLGVGLANTRHRPAGSWDGWPSVCQAKQMGSG